MNRMSSGENWYNYYEEIGYFFNKKSEMVNKSKQAPAKITWNTGGFYEISKKRDSICFPDCNGGGNWHDFEHGDWSQWLQQKLSRSTSSCVGHGFLFLSRG